MESEFFFPNQYLTVSHTEHHVHDKSYEFMDEVNDHSNHQNRELYSLETTEPCKSIDIVSTALKDSGLCYGTQNSEDNCCMYSQSVNIDDAGLNEKVYSLKVSTVDTSNEVVENEANKIHRPWVDGYSTMENNNQCFPGKYSFGLPDEWKHDSFEHKPQQTSTPNCEKSFKTLGYWLSPIGSNNNQTFPALTSLINSPSCDYHMTPVDFRSRLVRSHLQEMSENSTMEQLARILLTRYSDTLRQIEHEKKHAAKELQTYYTSYYQTAIVGDGVFVSSQMSNGSFISVTDALYKQDRMVNSPTNNHGNSSANYYTCMMMSSVNDYYDQMHHMLLDRIEKSLENISAHEESNANKTRDSPLDHNIDHYDGEAKSRDVKKRLTYNEFNESNILQECKRVIYTHHNGNMELQDCNINDKSGLYYSDCNTENIPNSDYFTDIKELSKEISPDKPPKTMLNPQSVKVMNDWFKTNRHNPYPSVSTINQLAEEGGISPRQVRKWFANRRVRTGFTKEGVNVSNRGRKISVVMKDVLHKQSNKPIRF